MRFAATAAALLLPLALSAGSALAQAAPARMPRLALVIGNGAYKDSPLANPTNDAADMARVLEASGFTVIKRENATLREMHLALREFGDRLGRQTTGLVYFAGHGMQVRGRNYLIPVDADIAREDEVAFAALDLGALMDKLDSAKNPVNIVILDACRNNPFGSRLTATARGLAPVDAPPGTFIAFATAPGSTAADGGGRNGLYTQHLVRHLEKPGLAIEEVFKAVRVGVRSDSKGAQIPWESTSLETSFRFRNPPPEKRPPVVAAAKPAAPTTTTPARALPTSLRAPPTFQAGDTWTYRVIDRLAQSERRTVMRVKEVRGDEVHFANGNVGDLYGNMIRVVRNASRTDEYTPHSHQYMFPMKAGDTWRFKSQQKRTGDRLTDLDEHIKVGDEEEVDTPAGKMRGVRIDREVRWKDRGRDNAGVNTFTYWYNSAAKRYVVLEQVNTTTAGKVLVDERLELVSYSVK
ncbi:MAG: caspase family protein [Usitatibacter sp.]